MKIGFIGLGNLGLPIAANLLEEEGQLYLYNRTASKAETLAAKGGIVCPSPKEVAEACDVIFTIVSEDAALMAVASGPDGLVANMKPGSIHVSLSTILPSTSTALSGLHAAGGVHYVACPVMARPEAARARKINFLVSGHTESIEKIQPLLTKAGAVQVWDFGPDPGAANVTKLCGNYLILVAMEAMAEATNLADRAGVPARAVMEMLTETIFNSPVYKNYGKLIMDDAFLPAAFALKLGLKDMNLAITLGKTVHAALPVGEKVKDVLSRSLSEGLGDHDVTAVALTIRAY